MVQNSNSNNKLFWGHFGLALILYAVLFGRFIFWTKGNFLSVPSTFFLLSGIALFVLSFFRDSQKNFQFLFSKPVFSPYLLCLILLFFSSWLENEYNIFNGSQSRGELLLFFLVFFCLLRSLSLKILTYLTLSGAVVFFAFCFIQSSGGKLLFSDDHPTFLYRLLVLKDVFPYVPFYCPLWNAGYDAREFYATATFNFFLLWSPLIYFFKLENIYNLVVFIEGFVLLPLASFLAVILLKKDKTTGFLAAILSLGNSIIYYRWLLQYGTMGFITSVILSPLNVALIIRIIKDKGSTPFLYLLLAVVTGTLMGLWSLSLVVFLPLAIYLLVKGGPVWRKPLFWAAVFLYLALNLPWMGVFVKVSKVTSFIASETAGRAAAPVASSKHLHPQPKKKKETVTINSAVKNLRKSVAEIQPIIWIFVLPAFLFTFRFLGAGHIFYFLWCIVLSTVLVDLKPQLELDRIILFAVFWSVVPISIYLTEVLSKKENFLKALLFSIILTSYLGIGSAVKGRHKLKISFAEDYVYSVISFLKSLPEKNGRVVFSGFILHEFSGGHIAPLAPLVKKPLVASQFTHRYWYYRDVIPPPYRKEKIKGVLKYLDIINAGIIISHDKNWRNFFRQYPEYFKEIRSFNSFTIFKRRGFVSNYFLQGSGSISQNVSSVTVKMNSKTAVIKFNYFPFLTSSTCSLSPYPLKGEINLIKINCLKENETLTIKAVSPWQRMLF